MTADVRPLPSVFCSIFPQNLAVSSVFPLNFTFSQKIIAEVLAVSEKGCTFALAFGNEGARTRSLTDCGQQKDKAAAPLFFIASQADTSNVNLYI